MKPHPSIFLAALALMRVAPADAVMVGDSLVHDVMGARHVGMRAVLLARGQRTTTVVPGESVIRTLTDLPPLL
jgi:putative hydrolase of the HAD superfamily